MKREIKNVLDVKGEDLVGLAELDGAAADEKS